MTQKSVIQFNKDAGYGARHKRTKLIAEPFFSMEENVKMEGQLPKYIVIHQIFTG